MPTIYNWKAYRSGHDVTVKGVDPDGGDMKVCFRFIEACPEGIVATTKDGKKYRLALLV